MRRYHFLLTTPIQSPHATLSPTASAQPHLLLLSFSPRLSSPPTPPHHPSPHPRHKLGPNPRTDSYPILHLHTSKRRGQQSEARPKPARRDRTGEEQDICKPPIQHVLRCMRVRDCEVQPDARRGGCVTSWVQGVEVWFAETVVLRTCTAHLGRGLHVRSTCVGSLQFVVCSPQLAVQEPRSNATTTKSTQAGNHQAAPVHPSTTQV